MKRAWIVGIGLLVAGVAAQGQGQAQGQGVAERIVAQSNAPAAAVGWIDAGQSRVAIAGQTAVRGGAPVTAAARWHIGALTKPMTATLVARLVEAGRITWEDSVGEVLRDRVPYIHPSYASLTYVDLLTHTGGLPPNIGSWDTMELRGVPAERDISADRLRYAGTVLALPPEGPRGAFLYSNAGYTVAGAMLEAATGVAWEDLIRAEVFTPLGMESPGFGAPAAPDPRGHRKWLFGLGPLVSVAPGPEADTPPAMGPAGTLHMTMADLLRFLAAHMERPEGYLTAASWQRLQTPPEGGVYAMGWGVTPDGALGHAGSNRMWFAAVSVWPRERQALAMAVNVPPSEDVEQAFRSAAAELFPDK